MEYKAPYDTLSMAFDTEREMYILTVSFASKNGYRYRDDATTIRRLTQISNNVYNYIYANGHTANKKTTEKILNSTEEGRKFIMKVLEAQLTFDFESKGANDNINMNAINWATSRYMSKEIIAQNRLGFDAQSLIESSASYLEGYNVVCPFPIIWRF